MTAESGPRADARPACLALMAQGNLELADAELVPALKAALDVGNPPQVCKIHAALGELWAVQGRGEAARQAYAEALSVINAVAFALTDEHLSETLLASAHVQWIRRAAVGG